VLVAQTAVLWMLRVPWGLQAAVLLAAGWATLTGAGLLRGITAGIGDAGARFAVSFLGGMAAITGTCYVLFHRAVWRVLGLDGPAAAVGLALSLVGLAALVVGLRCRPERRTRTSGTGPGGVLALLLALALSGATVYGVANTTAVGGAHDGAPLLEGLDRGHPLVGSTLPEWGHRDDFYAHLVAQPALIQSRGLPVEPIQHYGLGVWLLSTSLGLDGFDLADPVQAAKVLAVPVWFSLLALARFGARWLLELGRLSTLGAVLGVAFFAAVNYPILDTSRSSYLPFIGASGTLYHNLPQLYVTALGMAAVVLIGLSGRSERWGTPFVAGAAFVAASFVFKPSLFVVFATAIFVAAALAGKRRRKAALGAVGVLLLPVLWWVFYPRLVGISDPGPDTAFELFGFHSPQAADRFPAWISSSPWRLASAIVVFSFAVWIVPVAAWLWRAAGTLRRCRRAALGAVRDSPLQVVVVVALVLGLAIAGALVEAGARAGHGNFVWSVGSAYAIAMPLLIRLAADLRSRLCRLAVAALFALHLAAGGLHLWILTTAGHL